MTTVKTPADASEPVRPAIPAREFVAMVAGLMALNALAIDLMLPALGTIAMELGVPAPNDRQHVVLAYVLGFGFPQLIFGPLTDRFGRRPLILFSLAGYTVAGLSCAAVPSFTTLLALRFLQGAFASGVAVVAQAVVRDLFVGSGMARVMSLVMMVFMVSPVVAPGLGQLILFVAPWRGVFGVLGVAGFAMFVWVFLRLQETLPAAPRTDIPGGGGAGGGAEEVPDASLGGRRCLTLRWGRFVGGRFVGDASLERTLAVCHDWCTCRSWGRA